MACCVYGCPYNKQKGYKRKSTNASIHRFPADPAVRKLWVEFVTIQNNKEFNYQRHHRLCSQHFSSDSLIDRSLKFRSVPTEFHVRYETSEDGWCDKPELVFGLNKTTQSSEGFISNHNHDKDNFLLDEPLIDDPTVFVPDHIDMLSVKNEDNNGFDDDPLRIETSTTNAMMDGFPGHSSHRTAVSMPDPLAPEKPVRLSTQEEVYSPDEVASRLREEEPKRHIDDFTESDFDTPRKRARNLQHLKNLVRDGQRKLRNARKKALRWEKKSASLKAVIQELKEKDILGAQQVLQVINLYHPVK